MDKQRRLELAQSTLDILKQGSYRITIDDLGDKLAACLKATKYYGPDDEVAPGRSRYVDGPTIEVMPWTTLETARRLCGDYVRVGVLNFASGKNPGGGFLRGTEAQEETLARSSGLYSSLTLPHCARYYEANKESKDPRYTDAMIWSPDCPVFRDDDGFLIGDPYQIDIITCAAPNYTGILESGKYKGSKADLRYNLRSIFERRVFKVLRLFSHHSVAILVLGAWGCGVFGNDTNMVAQVFRKALFIDFSEMFEKVVFAIPPGPNHDVFVRNLY